MSDAGIWFVTGVSSGLGREVALAALGAGAKVAGTVRSEADLAAFEALAPGRAAGVRLDVADHAAVAEAVESIEGTVGPIEVVVNNAGYGHEGAVETVALEDLRRLYDANLFGAVAVVQAVLPHMRVRGRGRILNISSITSVAAPAGLGAYASSKAAMNCLSEVLAKEVAPFGIQVVNILPGSFRTRWAGHSLKRVESAAYPHLAELSEARRRRDGAQTGDPRKFAALVLRMAQIEDPPVHIVAGPNALRLYRDRGRAMNEEAARFEALSAGTDFD